MSLFELDNTEKEAPYTFTLSRINGIQVSNSTFFAYVRKQGIVPIMYVGFASSCEFPDCFYTEYRKYLIEYRKHLLTMYTKKELNAIQSMTKLRFNHRITDEQLIEFDSIALASPHGFDVFIEYIYNEFVLNQYK